jgi:hypothetical protein
MSAADKIFLFMGLREVLFLSLRFLPPENIEAYLWAGQVFDK